MRLEPGDKRVVVGPRKILLTHILTLKETNWLGGEASIEAAAAADQPSRVLGGRPASLA